jgi:hypothetical protein
LKYFQIPKNHYIKSKSRGNKRKFANLIQYLNNTELPPIDSIKIKYWNQKFPCSNELLDTPNVKLKTRKFALNLLLNKAQDLRSKLDYKVITVITLPFIWYSEIMVVIDDSYLDNFFNRNSESFRWTPLNNQNSINELELNTKSNIICKGYLQNINDEDEVSESEIWFVGDLPE